MIRARGGRAPWLLVGGAALAVLVGAGLWLAGDDSRGGAAPVDRVEVAGRHDADLPGAGSSRTTGRPTPIGEGVVPLGPGGAGGLRPTLLLRDAGGRPVPDALVLVGASRDVALVAGAPDPASSAAHFPVTLLRTDEEGRCPVHLLDADHAVFAARADLGSTGLWSAAPLFAAPRDEVELVLVPPARLVGHVTDRDGRPLPRASVSFSSDPSVPREDPAETAPRVPRTQVTDAAGRFVLELDAPQSLRLRASLHGSRSEDVPVTVQPGEAAEVLLSIGGG